jgi:hypothetical protein
LKIGIAAPVEARLKFTHGVAFLPMAV